MTRQVKEARHKNTFIIGIVEKTLNGSFSNAIFAYNMSQAKAS